MASSAVGHEYDEDLLNAAPKPDRKQLQEGYDADILTTKPEPSKKRSNPPEGSGTPTRDLEHGGGATTPQGARSKSSLGVTPTTAAAGPPSAAAATTANNRSSRQVKHAQAGPPAKKKKVPFYKTRKGMVIIAAVLIAVIVAAVVGGVVGSRRSSSSSSSSSPSGSPAQGDTQGSAPNTGQDTGRPTETQGAAPDPSATQGGGVPDDDGGTSGIGPIDVPTTDDGPQFEGVPPLRRRGWVQVRREN